MRALVVCQVPDGPFQSSHWQSWRDKARRDRPGAAWVRRAILGQPSPWDPLDLPHDEMYDEPSVPWDKSARPSLDQVLALRADRMATVREVIAGLTDATLAGMTKRVTEPGYPPPESFPVRRCLQAILIEEWEHRLYAERDLDLLTSRSPG